MFISELFRTIVVPTITVVLGVILALGITSAIDNWKDDDNAN